MNRLSRILGLGALLGTLVAVTYVCTASAGAKQGFPVLVNTLTRTASGSAGSARNSADVVQYITCGLTGTATSVSATCMVRSTTSPAITCTSSNPNIVGAVKAMSSDSFVSLQWDSSSTCTLVAIDNGSTYDRSLRPHVPQLHGRRHAASISSSW